MYEYDNAAGSFEEIGGSCAYRIRGYRLVCTSTACPEQYDVVFPDGRTAGYLRLRHGSFRADVPYCGGDTVYSSYTKGDGVFEDDERLSELENAVAAIDTWWRNRFSASE